MEEGAHLNVFCQFLFFQFFTEHNLMPNLFKYIYLNFWKFGNIFFFQYSKTEKKSSNVSLVGTNLEFTKN